MAKPAFEDVQLATPIVKALELFTLTFRVTGGEDPAFQFPFSNEHLTEAKIQFLKEEVE